MNRGVARSSRSTGGLEILRGPIFLSNRGTKSLRILVWATHPQFDIMAFASYLDQAPGVELLVVARKLAAFLAQPFARVRPFSATLLDWDDPSVPERIRKFSADVAIMDNRLPPIGSAPRLVNIGHGLGWKNVGSTDLWIYHQGQTRFTGYDSRRPNPNLLVLCYGDTDLRWRTERWGLDPANCRKIGMPFADLVADPPYVREELVDDYRIDIRKKTVLLNITWHYGAVFAQPAGLGARIRRLLSSKSRSRDFDFIERLAEATAARDANIIFCLHERKRYSSAIRRRFEAIAARWPNMELKYKDERPDNLADLLVSDVMVSNYSSFITPFYLLARPAIHIRPVARNQSAFEFSMLTFAGLWGRTASPNKEAYMMDLDDTGGPIVENADDAIAAVLNALDHPDECRATTAAWLDRHLYRPEGGAAVRLFNQIVAMCERVPKAVAP